MFPTADPHGQEARDMVAGPVREAVAAHRTDGTEAHVGGTAAVFSDIASAVDEDVMLSVGLGFAAALGASTLVFQHGAGRPGVDFSLPLVPALAAILGRFL
ncbi:MMPL family transporter [Streptomyces sp. NBC_01244]|nr:MMPL family transporter [Streptomyces sp. NBC_01244]